MGKNEHEELDVYIIPPNFIESGKIFRIRFCVFFTAMAECQKACVIVSKIQQHCLHEISSWPSD